MIYHVNSPYFRQFLTSMPKQFKKKAAAVAAQNEASAAKEDAKATAAASAK